MTEATDLTAAATLDGTEILVVGQPLAPYKVTSLRLVQEILALAQAMSFGAAPSGAGITALFASPPAVGGTAAAAGTFTTLSSTGNLLAGGESSASWGAGHRVYKTGAEGTAIVSIDNGTQHSGIFYGVSSGGAGNTAASALRLGRNTTTVRSINAEGTINAGGADVAEAKWKRNDCLTIAKGQVCGLDAYGRITDRWSLMKSPRFKTGLLIEPGYVMGDSWGSADTPCILDGLPLGESPSPPDGEEVPPAVLAAYEAELEAWTARFDANRERIDRLVYCGTNGVRLDERQGTRSFEAGDYIVLTEAADDAIGWEAVAPADMTMAQLHLVIGRVERVEPSGVPLVAARV